MCKNLDEETALNKVMGLIGTQPNITPYIGIGLCDKPIGKLTGEDFIRKEKLFLANETQKPEMKYCSACKKEHPVNDFNKDVTTKDGHRRICQLAQMEQTKAKREEYRVTKKEYGVLLRFDLAGESGKALCTSLRKDAEANRRTLENHIIFLLENLPQKV